SLASHSGGDAMDRGGRLGRRARCPRRRLLAKLPGICGRGSGAAARSAGCLSYLLHAETKKTFAGNLGKPAFAAPQSAMKKTFTVGDHVGGSSEAGRVRGTIIKVQAGVPNPDVARNMGITGAPPGSPRRRHDEFPVIRESK